MRGVFWAQLETAIQQVAEEELSRAGHSIDDCPYLRFWLAFYRGASARRLERAIQRYAQPAQTDADSLRDAVTERVRQAVRAWIDSGSFPALPPEVTAAMPGSLASPLAGAASAPMQTKPVDGDSAAVPQPTDPAAVRRSLHAGLPLEGSVRARMERGFGHSFADVHLHTDASAGRLATAYAARAFTVGSDVAFGAERYRPGTIEGDLLLAHELAHVLQQRGATHAVPAAARNSTADTASLETAADLAAARAVARTTPAGAVRTAARSALGQRHEAALEELLSGETEHRGAFAAPRLPRCELLDPPEPHLETDWDEGETAEPEVAEAPPPSAPVPVRTPAEEAAARAAENTFAIRQIWSILSGIDPLGAELEFFFFTSGGAITMDSWRRTQAGSGRGAPIPADAFTGRLERFVPTFVGTDTRYIKLTFRRERTEWDLRAWSTEAPPGAPPVPPEARTAAARVTGHGVETFSGVVAVGRAMQRLLQVYRNGSTVFIASVHLEDDRVVRWEPESITNTIPSDAGAITVPAAEFFANDIDAALLPFTTGIGTRTIRIELHGTHRRGQVVSDWSVHNIGVVRPAAPVVDEAEAIVADYRRRHQEIIRRWREGTRDIAVYMAMIGVREIGLWVIGGAIFRVAGLGLRAVAPRLLSIVTRGGAASAGFVETLITRLAPTERAALTRLMAKVETQGASALSTAERAELQRLFRLLDDLVEAPLTLAEKNYLRSAMVARYEAAYPAAVAAFRSAGRAYQIHHRLPLEWAHRFPGVDINAGTNLIALETTVHRGVNAVWTRFRIAPASRVTAAHVERVAAIVDRHFNHWYHNVPSATGSSLATTVEAAKNAARAEVDILLRAL